MLFRNKVSEFCQARSNYDTFDSNVYTRDARELISAPHRIRIWAQSPNKQPVPSPSKSTAKADVLKCQCKKTAVAVLSPSGSEEFASSCENLAASQLDRNFYGTTSVAGFLSSLELVVLFLAACAPRQSFRRQLPSSWKLGRNFTSSFVWRRK